MEIVRAGRALRSAAEAAMTAEPEPTDFLGPLLRTLAESLDVREIFAKISAEARRIVPHDFLMLGLISEENQTVRVFALSGDLAQPPGELKIPEAMRFTIGDKDVLLLRGVEHDAEAGVMRGEISVSEGDDFRALEVKALPLFQQLAGRGLHSFLRVAVRLRGGVLGGLVFCSQSPAAYGWADVPRARQIMHCVALALAHQRLAEEEQRSLEARTRAARLEVRLRRLTEEMEEQGRHRVLGQSKRWKDVIAHAAKVAPTEATVLLTGESGTGKEVVARLVHRTSPRAEGPFVALNCAALPEQLLESELFGHEKGAFTGAVAARPGRIEQASGGVLFLDEVGEMSPAVQAKFLRVLQEREFQRLGGTKTIKADVRVLAATNRDLKAASARGAFREDLYYRLAVFEIPLPSLRERPEDILLLVDAFLEEIGRSIGRPAAGVSQEVRATLVAYGWPGNVRELRNAIERAVILCEGGLITSEHLPIGVVVGPRAVAAPSASSSAGAGSPASAPESAAPVPGGAGSLEAAEREMIVQALSRAGNNKSKAARFLGLTRAQLRSRIEKHGLVFEG
jgi:transcriptional regulator with GAF, ATPase, and Fis domain